MPLILSHRIREEELGGPPTPEVTATLLRSARVALATPISGKGLPPKSRLLKAYATTAQGPRRLVYLLAVEDGALFLLFYRGKNDVVGADISPKNPAFARQLQQRLGWLQADIESGRFDTIELPS